MEHLDDNGQPCARHAVIAPSRLYELATLGSRMPGFHHDMASKLQSLMMALDEISELADSGDPDLRRAADTAHMALRDLHQLINANRSLAKTAQSARVALADLLRGAADRVGVKMRAELPAGDVRVAGPAVTHALALLVDLVAGPAHLGRVVDVGVEIGELATITISGPAEALAKPPVNANETIAIASFVLERDEGRLRCKRDANAIVVRLPVAPPPETSQPLKRARTEGGNP